ncbi:phosphotransferase family protein [Sciscionella sediminilitoris]|uniref:phosphotransferase family protein n=1 Tax=Sciscionella sediminilitoris TaxID=1445613 RepID=UPI0009E70130|nr:phosphotransferase family protein [Sciscionella sp. SE31]
MVPEAGRELSARLLTGGKSNLTYEIGDGARTWILRRPPLGHVLATAHDMGREYRVMSALRDTEVPVPRMYALCQDEEPLGAPFYVMERVSGTPYRYAKDLAGFGPARTRALSSAMVGTLAELHAVDPAAVGLTDFGRPQGFLDRQVHRWRKQLDASHSRELPAAEELFERLAARVPEESAFAIVHGDYRLDNLLVDAGDRITAVLDWEMATLGDPLTDLALMLVYHRLAVLGAGDADACLAPGFLTEEEIIERYAEQREPARFGFYLGLASFKLAVILEGIHYRHRHGQTVGQGFERVGESVVPILEAGLQSLEEYR